MDVTRFSIGGLADSSRAMGGSVSGCPSKTDRRLAALASAVERRQAWSFRNAQGYSEAPRAPRSTLYGEQASWWLRRVRHAHIGIACVYRRACTHMRGPHACCTPQSRTPTVAAGLSLCVPNSHHRSQRLAGPANRHAHPNILPEDPVCRLPDASENAPTLDVISAPKKSAQSAGRL